MYEIKYTIKDNNKVLDFEGKEIIGPVLIDCNNTIIKNAVIIDGVNFSSKSFNNTLENCTIKKSKSVGIYFRSHSHHNTVTNCLVENVWGAGIYLDQCYYNVIKHTEIRNCGFKTTIYKNIPFPRIGWAKREGVAIDASYSNTIEYCTIINCGHSRISLYRNGGEFGSHVRPSGSNYNIIRNNYFYKVPVGVWIASRQSRDLLGWEMSLKSIHNNPMKVKKGIFPFTQRFDMGRILHWGEGAKFRSPIIFNAYIWQDEADNNSVLDNTFERCYIGVKNEGYGNGVQNNLYEKVKHKEVIGSPYME